MRGRDVTACTPELLRRFRHLHAEPPTWAWQFKPSCPLVGRQYKPGRGLLVYASAENFTCFTRKEIPERFNDERAWDRYRACFEENGRSGKAFFPVVGIQPVTDGGLFAAALLVSERLGLPTAPSPRDFLEHVAFSNWAKFSIKADGKAASKNEDYAGVEEKLGDSLAFVVTELVVLQPKAALLPKSIWRQKLLREAMRGASPFTTFLPVPQFNATVVNCHLEKHSAAGQRLQRRMACTPLAEWMRNLYGFRENCAWRYLALLDEKLAND